MQLPDGRQLGFAEVGPVNGRPVFYIPRCPDNRVGILSSGDIAEKLNIRLIGIDRPGYGLSTHYPDRKIMDFVDDFKHIKDHLKIEEYSMFSVSGGTAYLLACARHLPRNQLRGVGIFTGICPPEGGWRGEGLLNQFGMSIWYYMPRLMRAILDRYIVPLAQHPGPEKMAEFWSKELTRVQGKDKDALKADFDLVVDIWIENYKNGSGGNAEDVRLMLSDWGLKLGDIDRPVRMWYGAEDVNTPVYFAKYMLRKLPNASLRVLEGETHSTIFNHMEDFLGDLIEDM